MENNTLFGHPINNKSIEKYLIIFGKLFSNIILERNNGTDVKQSQRVPISFVSREVYETREKDDPNANKEVGMLLPRMVYNLTNIAYDSSRQTNSLNKKLLQCGLFYQPVPVTLSIELSIKARNISDMYKIYEQIAPYFSPTFTVSSNIIDGCDCQLDIPITISPSIAMMEDTNLESGQTRSLIWELNFTIPAYIFGNNVLNGNNGVVIRWVRNDFKQGSGTLATSNTHLFLANTDINNITENDEYTIVTDVQEII